jgi:hypothetical protein
MKITTKLWLGLGVLSILSPLGLYLPEKFKAGSTWGEWGADEIKNLAGYVPSGLQKLAELWKAVMPDYAFRGWEDKGLGQLSLAYIVAAVGGMALCVGLTFVLGKLLARKES